MADIRIEGADRLMRRLRNKVNKSAVNQVVKRNTSQVQEKAMKNAPVDTGFLKREIKLEMDNSNSVGLVIANAEYSPYLEYGTRFMSAQPFMRPAVREQNPIFISDLREMIRSR